MATTPTRTRTPDTVSLHALELAADIGDDQWGRARAQRVLLTVHVHTSLAAAGASDSVADTVHYGHLGAALFALETRAHASLAHLAAAAAEAARACAGGAAVHVRAAAPKLLLGARALCAEVGPDGGARAGAGTGLHMHIEGLALATLVGVNAPERVRRQQVVVGVSFWDCAPARVFPHRALAERFSEHIAASEFRTLEALATSLARVACFCDGMDAVTIKAHKPSAVAFGHSSGVALTRTRAFFGGRAA